jgi:DNA-binding protein HU-beta
LTSTNISRIPEHSVKSPSTINPNPKIEEAPMTKAELIEKIAKDAGIPKTTAKIAFESVFDSIKQGVQKKNHKVTLVGFGTFKNVYRKTRMGRNPQTGEKIKIKGRSVVTFKPSKNLP